MQTERGWVQNDFGWDLLGGESGQQGHIGELDEATLLTLTIAGVDEAGRGPLAGPVYAAAVVLDRARPIAGLADSKILKEADRDALAIEVRSTSLAWFIASASVEEIDSLNILNATMLAMRRAVEGLGIIPHLAQIDGNRAPRLNCRVQTVIGGDASIPAISAASILAKTARDAELVRLHAEYPHYGFDRHKGYGTAFHVESLYKHGPCAAHRRSFAPVRMALEGKPMPDLATLASADGDAFGQGVAKTGVNKRAGKSLGPNAAAGTAKASAAPVGMTRPGKASVGKTSAAKDAAPSAWPTSPDPAVASVDTTPAAKSPKPRKARGAVEAS